MRRKDREIADFEQIADVLARCRVLHVATHGAQYPYIAAVSFGMEVSGGRIALYIHSARAGEKLARLAADARVCVQAEIELGTQRTPGGITHRYESVVGFGTAREVTGEAQRARALTLINRHYGYDDSAQGCPSLPATAVFCIELERVTGKRNLPAPPDA